MTGRRTAAVEEALALFDSDSEETMPCDATKTTTVQIQPCTIEITASKVGEHCAEAGLRLCNSPWRTRHPKYVNKMQLVDTAGAGGGRGFIALEDLEPGTLLMLEDVYLPWPENVDRNGETLLMLAVEGILQRPDFIDIRNNILQLHPRKLSDVPTALVSVAREKFFAALQSLSVKYHKNLCSAEELLQIVLALQSNAFGSGLFLHCSLFNHDCNPNCVKFTPTESSSLSEVRTSKKILKGEPLTISYLYPREQSRSIRESILWNQFGFLCKCPLCNRGDSALLLPHSIEKAQLEYTVEDIEGRIGSAETRLRCKVNIKDAAQILSAGLECLSDTLEILAHDHLVLIRIYRFIANSLEICLKNSNDKSFRANAVLFVRTAYELLSLQRQYLTDDHIDLARTLYDLSQGIQLLLSYDVDALLQEFPEWKDFRNASIVENKYRQEHVRVKKLYDRVVS